LLYLRDTEKCSARIDDVFFGAMKYIRNYLIQAPIFFQRPNTYGNPYSFLSYSCVTPRTPRFSCAALPSRVPDFIGARCPARRPHSTPYPSRRPWPLWVSLT